MIKLIATLATATAFSLSASFAAFSKDDKAAAGVTRKEVLATSTNMVDAPIAFPAKAGKVTAEMVKGMAEMLPGAGIKLQTISWIHDSRTEGAVLEVRVRPFRSSAALPL